MTHCYEIVSFAFKAETAVPHQQRLMAAVGEFARMQPGFVERSCYYDPKANRWTDLVAWRSAQDAIDAMTNFDKSPATAEARKCIDPASVYSGHYDKVV